MKILKEFQKNGSTLSSLDGATPSVVNLKDSKLHNTFSINGNPNLPGIKRSPSTLDLDGKTPKSAYKNTAPENQGGRI